MKKHKTMFVVVMRVGVGVTWACACVTCVNIQAPFMQTAIEFESAVTAKKARDLRFALTAQGFLRQLTQTEHGTKNLCSVDGSCCSLGLCRLQVNPLIIHSR